MRERSVGETFALLLAVEAADIVAGQLLEFAPTEFGDDVMVFEPNLRRRLEPRLFFVAITNEV